MSSGRCSRSCDLKNVIYFNLSWKVAWAKVHYVHCSLWENLILCRVLTNVVFLCGWLCSFSSPTSIQDEWRGQDVHAICRQLMFMMVCYTWISCYKKWVGKKEKRGLLQCLNSSQLSLSSSHQNERRGKKSRMSYLQGRSHWEGMARSQQSLSLPPPSPGLYFILSTLPLLL